MLKQLPLDKVGSFVTICIRYKYIMFINIAIEWSGEKYPQRVIVSLTGGGQSNVTGTNSQILLLHPLGTSGKKLPVKP